MIPSARREHGRVALALLFSLLIHALLLSLKFGDEASGFPGLAFPWRERRIEAPALRVMLVPAHATHAGSAADSAAPPSQRSLIEPAAGAVPTPSPASSSVLRPRGDAVANLPAAQPAPQAIATPNAVAREVPATALARVTGADPAELRYIPEHLTSASREHGDMAQEQQRQEATRIEAARVEAARAETERQELARQAAARQEAQRQEAARQEAERIAAATLEAERREAARQAALLTVQRQEAARREAVRDEADRLEAERQEAARQAAALAEARRLEAARQEADRIESERLEAGRQEAARRAAALAEVQRQEATRQEAARVEAARLEAERQEAERQEAERQQAARQEAARIESERLEAEREEHAQQQAARQEAQRQEAARQEAARVQAAREAAAQYEAQREARLREIGRQLNERAAQRAPAKQETPRADAGQDAEAKREARLREIGRQLDAEAARRDAPATAARARNTLPFSLSTARRVRLWGRAHPNAELAQYAEVWSQKIEANTPVETVRELTQRPHTPPMVTVAVRSDGSVELVSFDVSSGVAQVDEAIRRIVERHKPYPAFPPALARDFDVVEIRRTWHFDSAVRLN